MSSRRFCRRRAFEKTGFSCQLRRVFWGVAAPILLFFGACDNADSPLASEPAAQPSIYKYVTGEAADALLHNGQLRLAGAESNDGTPIITADRAIQLANAYVRTYGYSFKPMWERQRGGPVDLATIAAAQRVYFAQTPYGRFPEGFHPAFKRWYGPWYQVTLTSRGVPVVLMAVSAYLTDYKIDENGLLVLPIASGNDFVHMAISSQSDGFAPLSPEEAVSRIAEASGARINRTPALVLTGAFSSPLFAVWQLSLEKPASVDLRQNRETQVLFAGPMGRENFLVAAAEQPTFDSDVGRRIGSRGEPLAVEHFQVPVRAGHAVRFERARLSAAGGVQ